MGRTIRLFCVMATLSASAVAQAPSRAEPDLLTKMFTWWNAAYKVPGSFTAEAFSKYFTDDAVLRINGRVSAKGINEWASHFQHIQAGGGSVEIVLPFLEEFDVGNRIYTYHVIRSVHGGVTECQLVAGHAIVRDGRLALVSLVRTAFDPTNSPAGPTCSPSP